LREEDPIPDKDFAQGAKRSTCTTVSTERFLIGSETLVLASLKDIEPVFLGMETSNHYWQYKLPAPYDVPSADVLWDIIEFLPS
jgi:hypothetical protein